MSSGAITFASTNSDVNTLCVASAPLRTAAIATLPEANVLASKVEWLFRVSGLQRGKMKKKGRRKKAPNYPADLLILFLHI